MSKPRCSLCTNATAFHRGLKGANADHTKLLFVAHKPDQRVTVPALPFLSNYEAALIATRTGQELGEILQHCGLGFDDLYWTNIYKCALPGRTHPTAEQYRTCYTTQFVPQVREFQPRAIVAFGAHVYRLMFPAYARTMSHGSALGEVLLYENAPTLISLHPYRIWAKRNVVKRRVEHERIRRFLDDRLK